jgi:hypothetical protein
MRRTYLALLFTCAACLGSTAASSQGHAVAPVEVYLGEPDEIQSLAQLQALADEAGFLAGASLDKTDKAPAPPLTAMVVSNVFSSNVGWEAIGSGQLSTFYNHGGAQLRVVTDELGYGHIPVARMLGAVLPSSANYQTQYICVSGGVLVLGCSPGQSIVGFRKYWNVDGRQSGNFSYQNTSTNSPWNTLSTAITIQ